MAENGEVNLWQELIKDYVAKSSIWFYANNYVPSCPERQKWISVICVFLEMDTVLVGH